MLTGLGVTCAWIAMSLAVAAGLGSLRRFGAASELAGELCADCEEISPQELYSLDPPAGAGPVR